MFKGIMALPNVEEVIDKLTDTAPTIRVWQSKLSSGRTYVALGVRLHVSPRGHWYRDGVTACRGCGAHLVGLSMAAKDSILDIWRCTHPGSQQDVAIALLGRAGAAL